jgi:hypothetical protein
MPPRNAFSPSDFSESLSRLKRDGITDLFLIPYYFSTNETSDSIFPTSQTISDSQFIQAIILSQDSGFNVTIKPHIDLLNGQPRYRISPENNQKWCNNYYTILHRYLEISNTLELHKFVIGTELDNVAETDEFIALIAQARKSYMDTIVYAASYDHFVNARIWKYVDILGVDAYFNLDNNTEYSCTSLMDSWNYWLNVISKIATNYGKPVIITEIGYCSNGNSTKNPGTWNNSAGLNIEEQADCYNALLLQACYFDKIIGIFWWQWELGQIGGIDNNDYTPRDKQAEEVLMTYWGNK